MPHRRSIASIPQSQSFLPSLPHQLQLRCMPSVYVYVRIQEREAVDKREIQYFPACTYVIVKSD